MGLLTENKEELENPNILERHGFERENSSISGEIPHECYQKAIKLFPNAEYSDWMWVSVSTQFSEVALYFEYDCGGEIRTTTFSLTNSFDENEEEFFNELDRKVTEHANEYKCFHIPPGYPGNEKEHDYEDDDLEP